ncbi:hypothetical protein M514_07195 [Trichuris suis]|uniref:Uncharacterized protein n=1 Tax=Trichuris suis TaxID=68888 RepID=A0A085NC09_9BILA|nr:hypothetical protein M513_07195 [Trichuris suis]KFD67005.1 hypothetical protein M514_07195 [Trichuris suis]KHJ40352.1 hypothetical protein D918_09598 [Trichuris suis]
MEQLKRSRAGLKGRITVLKRELLEAIATGKKLSLIEDMERSLSGYMAKAYDVQTEIEQLVADDAELTEELESWMRFEGEVRNLLVQVKERVSHLVKDTPQENGKVTVQAENWCGPLLPKWTCPNLAAIFWNSPHFGTSLKQVSTPVKI